MVPETTENPVVVVFFVFFLPLSPFGPRFNCALFVHRDDSSTCYSVILRTIIG